MCMRVWLESRVKGIHIGSVFLDGVETGRKVAVWSEVAKQHHLPLHGRIEIRIKVQND